NYQSKISGPILDRFDLHVEVGSEELYDFNAANTDDDKDRFGLESSAIVASRVLKAREIQGKRYEGYGIRTNNNLDGKLLIECAMPIDEGREMLNNAATKFKLSMRG